MILEYATMRGVSAVFTTTRSAHGTLWFRTARALIKPFLSDSLKLPATIQPVCRSTATQLDTCNRSQTRSSVSVRPGIDSFRFRRADPRSTAAHARLTPRPVVTVDKRVRLAQRMSDYHRQLARVGVARVGEPGANV